MKKIILLSLCAGTLLFSSCDPKKSDEYKALASQNEELAANLAQKEQAEKDLQAVIDEVEQNLEQIRIAQGQISVYQGEGTPDARTRIQDNLASINQWVLENKEKLDKLEKDNKNMSASFQRQISSLKKQMEEKEVEIAELKQLLDEKNTQIQHLDSTIVVMNDNYSALSAEKLNLDNIAAKQDADLNTAYYFFGTAKDLKNKGIDVKKKGINKSHFTKIDIRDTQEIDLNSKSGLVLTNHPAASYRISVNGNKATLLITNPDEFWSMSKYLVVKTK